MEQTQTETVNPIAPDDTLSRSEIESAHTSNAAATHSWLRFPFDRINWLTSSFLIGTLALALTAVPLYLYHFGLDWFQVALFCLMFVACGFSISVGYHRLFSHLTFRASSPVRLFTLVFGAAAFEGEDVVDHLRAGIVELIFQSVQLVDQGLGFGNQFLG